MIANRCKTCRWWDNVHVSVKSIPATEEKPNPGFCRRQRPGVVLFKQHHMGVQPVMDADEFCKEYGEDT